VLTGADLCLPAEAVGNEGVVSVIAVTGADSANECTHINVLSNVHHVLALFEPWGVVVIVDHRDNSRHGSGPLRSPAVTCHHREMVLGLLQSSSNGNGQFVWLRPNDLLLL